MAGKVQPKLASRSSNGAINARPENCAKNGKTARAHRVLHFLPASCQLSCLLPVRFFSVSFATLPQIILATPALYACTPLASSTCRVRERDALHQITKAVLPHDTRIERKHGRC